MTDRLRWARPPLDAVPGVRERPFVLDVADSAGSVPGILWQPSAPTKGPLVLIGHGGSGHKRNDRTLRLARWFALEAGVASLAVDGPAHGDRSGVRRGHLDLVASAGIEVVLDRMTSDWLAAVRAVDSSDEVDVHTLGYVGLSLGTRFGLPLLAALGEQVRGAVLGKFGVRSDVLDPRLNAEARVLDDARRVIAPVLFHSQTEDELFTRASQRDLFDEIGSTSKRLLEYPGAHGDTAPGAEALWCAFIAGHLGATPAS